MTAIEPEGWPAPVGFANGILAPRGRLLCIAGQVGRAPGGGFAEGGLAPQFAQALDNLLAVVAAAGGEARDVCRITAFCTDREAYLAARPDLGPVWHARMGRHYPAMALVFVAALVDAEALIELEATAVIPA